MSTPLTPTPEPPMTLQSLNVLSEVERKSLWPDHSESSSESGSDCSESSDESSNDSIDYESSDESDSGY
jgi:hypothetical protein